MHISQLESGLHTVSDRRETETALRQQSGRRLNAYGCARLMLGSYIETYETAESQQAAAVKRAEIEEAMEQQDPIVRITRFVDDIDIDRPNPALPSICASMQADEIWVGRPVGRGWVPGTRIGTNSTRYSGFTRLAGLHAFEVNYEGWVDGTYEHIGSASGGLTDEALLRLWDDPSYAYRSEDITGDPKSLADTVNYYTKEIISLALSRSD